MTADDLVHQLWDVADMMDRVKRANAARVIASGEPIRDRDGYLNPHLLDGYNVVRAYIADVARDLGIDPQREMES